MAKIDLSLILPCYNEGSTFENSIAQILTVLKKLNKIWEVIFVEDNSTDETRKKVEKLTKQIKNSRAIFHLTNQGRGKSVSDGIRAAKGDICGYLDVDLEVAPSYIPLFVKEIEENNYDMVVGKRFYEGSIKSLTRFLASKIYAQMVKFMLKIPIEDTEAGYKFFRRSKILPILSKVKSKGWFWDTEICARPYWEGLRISEVPVLFVRRHNKKSTVRLIPDSLNYLIKLLKFRSQVPKKKL